MGTALTTMLIYSDSYMIRVGLGQRQMGLGVNMYSCGEEHLCSWARILGVLSSSKGLSGLMATIWVLVGFSLSYSYLAIWLLQCSSLKESGP